MGKLFETPREKEIREIAEAKITAHDKKLKKFKNQVATILSKNGVHQAEYYKTAIISCGSVNGHPDITVEYAVRMVDAAVNVVKLKIKKKLKL
jgi:ribosomal protein S21